MNKCLSSCSTLPATCRHLSFICVIYSTSGESLDEMKLLEEQARRIAEEAREDMPKKKAMSFVK